MSIIRVKRGSSTPTTSNLSYLGELAFDYGSETLYARGISSVVKIGGALEQVYFYQGYSYYHSLTYPFDPDYIYKVHVIASTQGTSTDSSDTYIYYRTSSNSSLYGAYINHHLNTEDTVHDKRSSTNTTAKYIEDSYATGPTITSGITKVIDFEISPTFKANYVDTQVWVAYGKSMTTLSGQGNGSIKMVDFVHTAYGDLGALYINPGMSVGSPDSISVTIYRMKRK
ncbi:hypothetical protein BK010_10595 (plasmid) [Tenericutes bacterium MO-XQ]|nr:hypothetical protein BK010_10595 [Tenericutes bacterium MO-XQ]